MSLQIRKLSYALGAEIIGIDIHDSLDDSTFRDIHAAFLEHCVLLFRKQPLTRQEHVVFSRRFGTVDCNEDYLMGKDTQYPEITLVKPDTKNKPARYVGDYWHSDKSGVLSPPGASMLRAVEVPDVGGDTMFANMYVAYESLSEGMKKMVDSLYCVHPLGAGTRRIDRSTPQRLAETMRLNPPVAQPLVSVHPETGRKSLYVGERVKQFAGMTVEESAPLLKFLCNHATRPQFVYRHGWQKDDLLIWDNRCTDHIALGDYDKSQVRHMEKTVILGTPIGGYAYQGPAT